MDEILVASIKKSNPVQKMIQEVDNALNKGHFQVKNGPRQEINIK